jgi:hypothetical protein
MRRRCRHEVVSEYLREIDVYVRELVSRLAAVTDGELVGAYLGGAYAFGAYEPGRSDLDVAPVVASPVSHSLKRAIVRRRRCPRISPAGDVHYRARHGGVTRAGA